MLIVSENNNDFFMRNLPGTVAQPGLRTMQWKKAHLPDILYLPASEGIEF
jgi:hypothetical protein